MVLKIFDNDVDCVDFKQILADLKRLWENDFGSKRIVLWLNRIPNLSEDDKKLLEIESNISFLYRIPIKYGLGIENTTVKGKSWNYIKDRITIDDFSAIRKMLVELLETSSETRTTDQLDKVIAIFNLMKSSFCLVQDEIEFNYLSVQIAKKIDGSIYNDLKTALESRRVTSQTYIVIVNELLSILGLKVLDNVIVVRNGLTEPEIVISLENGENVRINGKDGVGKLVKSHNSSRNSLDLPEKIE